MTAGPPVRGRLDAAGYVVDVGVVGERVARERVVAAWEPGSRLLRLPDGAWLLVLGRACSVRAEHAPGLPVPAGRAGDPLQVWRAGRVLPVDPDRLPPVDVSGWIDVSALPVHLLRRLDRAPAPPDVPEPAPVALTRLRDTLGLPPDPRAQRFAEALARAGTSWWGRLRGHGGDGPGTRPGPGGRTGRGSGRGLPGAGLAAASLWLAGLALTAPLGRLVRARHERYLRELADAFANRRFDEALRMALSVATAPGGSGVTVRLPSPRRGPLAPTPGLTGGGRAVISPFTVHDYLTALYTRAAEDLERAGQVVEAAFVHADLLGNARDAVAVLERHRRFELAAELAEGRGLDAELGVRLWWLAGRRDRAVDLARLRGAFAGAVTRLADTDPGAALDLRAEWVARLLESGDLHAAVDAAWPEPGLRPVVARHFGAGIAAGGPAGARLLAHLVTAYPTGPATDAALALLEGTDEALAAARAGFVDALAGLAADDTATDRRLASASLRLLVREPGLLSASGPVAAGKVAAAVRARAGGLLAADAPSSAADAAPDPQRPVVVAARPGPGAHAVRDAVAVPAGLLVALGESGVRLLGADGRVRARWPRPADQLVVADHGRSVLLVARGETAVEVGRLDLDDRRVRPWARLRAGSVAPTFDGALLVITGDDGLTVLDTTSPRPRTVWHDLEGEVAILALARGPRWMSALVQGPAVGVDGVAQLWTWSLPDLVLRHRSPVPGLAGRRGTFEAVGGRLEEVAVVAGAGLLARYSGEPGLSAPLRWFGVDGLGNDHVPPVPVSRVLAGGGVVATVSAADGGTRVDVVGAARIGHGGWPVPDVRVVLPADSAVTLRAHADVVTVHDGDGRVVAVDVVTGRIAANVTL